MKKTFRFTMFLCLVIGVILIVSACNKAPEQSSTPETTTPAATTPEQTSPEGTTPATTTPNQISPEDKTPENNILTKLPEGDDEIYEFYIALCNIPHNAQAFRTYMTFDNEAVIYKAARWETEYYDCYLLISKEEFEQEYWIVDKKSYRRDNGETAQKDASFEAMYTFVYYEAFMPIFPLAKEDLYNFSSYFDDYANAIVITFEAQTTYGTTLCYTITYSVVAESIYFEIEEFNGDETVKYWTFLFNQINDPELKIVAPPVENE